MKFEIHETIGKYPVTREIGSGATSKVYLARDPFADRDVAIKVFLFDKQADVSQERLLHKSFVAEASLAGKLNHPHIVDIYDAVVEPDRSYLVMEYVPGTTLEAHADVATLLPVSKVVEIVFKCIRALEYACRHGVIHRDIKPGNILLSETGETKVSDFGASFQQKMQETTQITGVGSPAYMSPEQIRMEQLTHQTDIYSLGVTMYRLLTGRLPFVASTQAALMYAILNTDPPRPATLRPELPGLLDAVVMKAMEKDPAARYQSWLDFGKDLLPWLVGNGYPVHTYAVRRIGDLGNVEDYIETMVQADRFVAPPSMIRGIRPPRLLRTCSARVGLIEPLALADGAASGRLQARSSACIAGWSGTRRPTLGRPAVTSEAISASGRSGTTRVSGPGQCSRESATASAPNSPIRCAVSRFGT